MNLWNFIQKYGSFHSGKCVWKCSLPSGIHSVCVSLCTPVCWLQVTEAVACRKSIHLHGHQEPSQHPAANLHICNAHSQMRNLQKGTCRNTYFCNVHSQMRSLQKYLLLQCSQPDEEPAEIPTPGTSAMLTAKWGAHRNKTQSSNKTRAWNPIHY